MRATKSAIAAAAILAALAAVTVRSATAQQRIVVPLSDPARPATLDVSLMRGNISISAYEGNEIVIVTSAGDEEESDFEHEVEVEHLEIEHEPEEGDDDVAGAPRPSREGLRQIRNSAIGLTAEENANTVTVETDWGGTAVDLEISVPRRTSVQVEMHSGDDLAITGVVGDHELMNARGDIAATDIGGSAVINTSNGDIVASFTEVTSGMAMSFTSFNGDIDVALPAALSATLVISAGRGDVFSDFDFTLEPQAPVVESGAGDGRHRVRLESAMRAVVGGGGPEVRFQTFNGDIVVRRR
jgi:DUF4097 and DUF4098 domain-containing protein YvlB